MRNKFSHWKQLILIVAFASSALSVFAANDELNAQKCSELLSGKTSFFTNPLQAINENLPSLISRLKPVHVNDRFDVRVLSRSILQNAFSPLRLKEQTVGEIANLQTAYDNLGFRFHSYLQVLVEANPNAMGQLQLGPKFQFIWHNSSIETPWVGNSREMIGIPNVFGVRSLFVGRVGKMGFEEAPRILVLPASTASYHSLQNRFIVSHELAHETENQKSHQDLMWREARADFLAYVTTGETEVIFPEGIKLALVRSDGSIYEETVTKARSLTEPTIASSAEIMPHLAAYHHNSQIISSVLFELGQKLGRKKMIEFVQWMDKQEGPRAIPKLIAKPKNPDGLIISAETEYVDYENLETVRNSILSHLSRLGDCFREWASQSQDAATQAIVKVVLSYRNI